MLPTVAEWKTHSSFSLQLLWSFIASYTVVFKSLDWSFSGPFGGQRKFSGNSIIASFFAEVVFKSKDLNHIPCTWTCFYPFLIVFFQSSTIIVVIDICIFSRVLPICFFFNIQELLTYERCSRVSNLKNADVEEIIGILCFNTLWQDCTISKWIKQLCKSQTKPKHEPKWKG